MTVAPPKNSGNGQFLQLDQFWRWGRRGGGNLRLLVTMPFIFADFRPILAHSVPPFFLCTASLRENPVLGDLPALSREMAGLNFQKPRISFNRMVCAGSAQLRRSLQ